MKIIIIGADGYLGWPTCMHFSRKGWEVLGIDNYFRRNASQKLNCDPLVQVPNLHQRRKLWKELTGQDIEIIISDIRDYNFLHATVKRFQPDVLIHYAEQPSAPYSMLDRDSAADTVQNNLITTLNVAYAVKEAKPDCHIIKLGTMGEYGTPNIDIEEGWLNVEHKGRSQRFLYPRQASSLYHTTKIQDTDMLWFYVRTWKLRVTDLMQGPVYGLFTKEMSDERLTTIFNYDEIFGTVLNRFLVQAASNFPLTVYGSGRQVRGYINLKDVMQCVYLSASSPAAQGEMRIFNQFSETFSVNELAEKVVRVAATFGYEVKINKLVNPRVEAEEHYYNPAHTGLLEMGLQPHLLTDEALAEIFSLVLKYKENIDDDKFLKNIKW